MPRAKQKGKQTIVQKHKRNFDTLLRAAKDGNLVLVECTETATGEKVAVICAVNRPDGEYELVPMARFWNGNPYDVIEPPTTQGKEGR
jgi:antitoxin (DNA-binding transcriptional repressor) of toxin-antitoxin stability system